MVAGESSLSGWRRVQGLRKRTLFLLFLLLTASVAGALSLITYWVRSVPAAKVALVAVVAPHNGPAQAEGKALVHGVQLYLQHLNMIGGIGGVPVRAVVADEGAGLPAIEQAVAEAPGAVLLGVIGHRDAAALAAATPFYVSRGIPVVALAPPPLPSASPAPPVPPPPGLLRLSLDPLQEARFLANYVRNILGERTIAVIAEKGPAGEALATAFDEVLQRFGTRVVQRWEVDASSPPDSSAAMEALATKVKDGMPVGTVALLTGPRSAAETLAALRRAGVRNRISGLSAMTGNAFLEALESAPRGTKPAPAVVNGVLATTPLLFDTADTQAQQFRTDYLAAFQTGPDWLAAGAYEAARLLLGSGGPGVPEAGQVRESETRGRLAALGAGQAPVTGILGLLAPDGRGGLAPTPLVGVYDGRNLVAAATQLSPIREEAVGSYLGELAAGRALYVNDRFMYKTNVVYTGIEPLKVSGFDERARTVEIEFSLWFRWRGELEPQDILFNNAVTPVVLGKPERESQNGDLRHRAYRVKGTFFIDYSDAARAYGTHVLGITFRHRTLNRNNLMYVTDVLGLGLGEPAEEVQEQAPLPSGMSFAAWRVRLEAWLRRLGRSQEPLTQAMVENRLLAGISGWTISRAWISQNLAGASTGGDPFFVGYGKPQPVFSQLDLGIVIKPDEPKARDFVPSRYFLYIAIFALSGTVLAALLDRKERGQFWRIQSLGLRLVCWPLLLTSTGNLVLDYALQNFTLGVVDTVVLVYQVLWWLVPARLFAIALERFLWQPLELRTGRRIPNVVRLFATGIIYVFALFGVMAFVMGKTITSLLATSGVLAMVVGLAIQANIANIFSGIILNLERPFKVGDTIRLGTQITGEVVDITWRTTRIRAGDGHLVCLANGKVSESEIHNLSDVDKAEWDFPIYIDPSHDPERILGLIREVLLELPDYTQPPGPGEGPLPPPKARFVGIENLQGVWAARYKVTLPVRVMRSRSAKIESVWRPLWARLRAAGVTWSPAQGPEVKDAGGIEGGPEVGAEKSATGTV